MPEITTLASKGLRDPKSLGADEIKQLAEKVAKEAHATASELAIAKKAQQDPKSIKPEEVKELAAHLLGEKSHSHKHAG